MVDLFQAGEILRASKLNEIQEAIRNTKTLNYDDIYSTTLYGATTTNTLIDPALQRSITLAEPSTVLLIYYGLWAIRFASDTAYLQITYQLNGVTQSPRSIVSGRSANGFNTITIMDSVELPAGTHTFNVLRVITTSATVQTANTYLAMIKA